MTTNSNGQPNAPAQSADVESNSIGDHRHVYVAIVGTGVAGIAMAHRLKQDGISDFMLLERASDLGGTWRDNTYPGCECDVPSILYSLSFAPNPNWSKSYSPQPEIWEYLQSCAKRFDVLPHIRFNHEVLRADWDDLAQLWRIETSQGMLTANFLLSGVGVLHEPSIPRIPGIEKFKGKSFHSARWDHGYELSGKRVAVVGTGASAIQFVPRIQPTVSRLHIFQRTPPWIVPRNDRKWTKFEKTLYRVLPFTEKIARACTYAWLELRVLGFVHHRRLLKIFEWVARGHIARQVADPELRVKVTPSYDIGCKRVLISNDFYPSIQRANVEIIAEGVRELREHSVVANDGTQREIDVIIWGTGFHVTDMPFAGIVHGRDGRSMAEVWDGTMKSYAGTAVHGFPNFFFLAGPNSTLGHSSVIYMIESNVEHISRALRFVESCSAGALEIRAETVETYDADIQSRLKETVWNRGGCSSWYLDANGRNTTLWPGFTFQFRAVNRRFDPALYYVKDSRGRAMAPSRESLSISRS